MEINHYGRGGRTVLATVPPREGEWTAIPHPTVSDNENFPKKGRKRPSLEQIERKMGERRRDAAFAMQRV